MSDTLQDQLPTQFNAAVTFKSMHTQKLGIVSMCHSKNNKMELLKFTELNDWREKENPPEAFLAS